MHPLLPHFELAHTQRISAIPFFFAVHIIANDIAAVPEPARKKRKTGPSASEPVPVVYNADDPEEPEISDAADDSEVEDDLLEEAEAAKEAQGEGSLAKKRKTDAVPADDEDSD